MTQRAKRFSWGLAITTAIVALAVSMIAVPGRGVTAANAPPREIVLEASGAAFSGDNPTLEFRRGERVRLIVRNTEPGVVHSIGVPSLGAPVVDVATGEEVVVEFTVDEAGTFDYICPRHLPLMKGTIVVRD